MKKNSFLEGAFIATFAIFLTKFIGIIYVIPFYKIVGTQGGALYGYAYNIYNLFLIISSAGIPLAISKLVSEYNALEKHKEKEYLYQIARKIIFIFSTVSFLICFIFAKDIAGLFNVDGGHSITDIAFVIRCVSFAILIVPLLSISKGFLQGHGYIKPASYSQILEQIVRVIIIIFGSFVALKIFNLELRYGIGIAVFGAAVSGLVALLYLLNKIKLIYIKTDEEKEFAKEVKKDIAKKLLMYSLPFIIINIANSLYNTTDMIILNNGLELVGYSGPDTETISSIFTTWGHKLNQIITSIATGVAISLIPSISENRAKKDYKGINDKFNKIFLIFLYIALPLALFMSIFSREIWTIFYGANEFGPLVFKFLVITAAIDALYIMICNGLQGLNKTKLIYVSVISGLLINICLDLPLILLFNRLDIYPFYGAILATIIGYVVTLTISMVTLKKEFKLDFQETINKIPKLFLTYTLLIVLALIYSVLIKNVINKIYLILLIAVIGIVFVIIYYLINKKEIEEILDKNIKDLIRKKRD